MTTLDLPDIEAPALIALLKHAIADDRYPVCGAQPEVGASRNGLKAGSNPLRTQPGLPPQ